MKLLFLAEAKKFFQSWAHIVVLSVVILMPFLALSASLYSQGGEQRMDHNTMLKGEQIRYQQDKLRNDMAGVVDEAWLSEREAELARMEEQAIDLNDLTYQTIDKAYWDGRIAYEMKQGLLEDVATPTHVKETYQSYELRYGAYEDWLLHFDSLSVSTMVYAVACIFLFSDLFNKEEETGAVELIRSSKLGRLPITTAKILLAISISLVLAILVYGMSQLASSLWLQLDDGSTTALMMRRPQYMSLYEINQSSCWLILIGGLITTTFSLCISSCIKKMSVTLSIGFLFILLPNLTNLYMLQTPWERYFPSVFLNISQRSLQYPWLNLGEYVNVAITMIPLVWIPIMAFMIWILYYSQCTNKKIPHIHARK